MSELTPCDRLHEPFYRTGYCVNCGVLAELHTAEGWSQHYAQRARDCASQAVDHERRATELRSAERRLVERATIPPTYTPQCRAGFWPVNAGTTGDSPICFRCGRDKADPVHAPRPDSQGAP